MDYTKNLVSFGLLIIIFINIHYIATAQTGICYGRLGDNLPSPSNAISLCNQYNIQRMRIYDPNESVLRALQGSNIELMLDVPNPDLQYVSSSQANANTWVQNNVLNYPDVRFRYIAVGNEVSPLKDDTSQFVNFVLPAMQNINNAISSAGLGDQIRVSTAIDTRVLDNTFPPENGVFRSEVTSYINPIVSFLVQNRSPLLANIYPYFAYVLDKKIDLEYALFTSDGIDVNGVRYQNLFYALLDGLYAALEKSGGSSLEVVVSESGWPSAGGDATSVDHARTYNTNLIQRVRSGTPKRPNRAIETYIFAMFDENQKSPEYEKSFGIFSANGQPKYPINFN
ncbi:hypothetical protein CASFOL_015759 [Castilleja foliolosa]|uniref:Glucan endo-1,3-beta-D-glucosidase n=1 Tax=Castilleja foliolosa TaxID=1961234 RepID=A0ABD3DEM3_9LAMI